MSVCSQCGKESPEGKFCQFCGSPLTQPTLRPEVVPPGTQPPPTQPAYTRPAYVPPKPGEAAGRPPSSAIAVFGIAGIISMLLTAIGSLLPWIVNLSWKIEGYNINLGGSIGGWDKDGKITIFLAVITLIFFLVGLIGKAKWPFIVGLLGSIIIAAVMIIDILDIATAAGLSISNVGYGLFLGIAAGIIGVISGIGGIAARRT